MDLHKLDEFIFSKMSETFLPGISIAIVKNNKIVYNRGFGFRDLEKGLEATPRTLYEIGSITKSFTALAVLQLMNEGKLRLENPVSRYIPVDLKSCEEPIQIWHLLTHSSGIPSLGYVDAIMRYTAGCATKWLPMASYDDLFTFMADANEWSFAKPGERWFYMNEGYVILGYIIEKLTGINYAEYIKQKILEPLGLARTFFRRQDFESDVDVATPYIITRDGECKRSRPLAHLYLSSDGGLISNVLDVARYINMYLNRGQLDRNVILPSELVEEMEKPRVLLPLQVFGGEAYGLGFSITPDFYGHKLVGHGGGGFRSTAYMGYIPEKRIGVALAANGSGYPLSQIGLYGLALMLGEDPEKLLFVRTERNFKALVGVYESYKGTYKASVSPRNGLLCIEMRDKYRDIIVPLIPENLEGDVKTFYAFLAGGKLKIEFVNDGGNTDLLYEGYRFRKAGRL